MQDVHVALTSFLVAEANIVGLITWLDIFLLIEQRSKLVLLASVWVEIYHEVIACA